MSHSIYTHRSDKRLREKDSVAKLSENGIGDLVLHLHFSYSVILPNLDILRSESRSPRFLGTIWSNKI